MIRAKYRAKYNHTVATMTSMKGNEMNTKTKLKDMTPEQKAQYHRDWRAKRKQEVSGEILHLEIHNCTPELHQAIINAIKESK